MDTTQGIGCRIITGRAGEENHAWVIAEVNGLWYNLDPTWDAGAEEYRYFLAGSSAFQEHIPDERFQTRAFRSRYPLARESYRKEGSK